MKDGTTHALLAAIFGQRLDGVQAGQFAEEVALANRRRLRVILPILGIGHLIHAVGFWPSIAEPEPATARILEWRQGIAYVHVATLAGAVALLGLAFSGEDTRRARALGHATAFVYLLHAAAIVGVDQLEITSVSPFVGFCLGVAGLIILTPRQAMTSFSIGLAAYVAGIQLFQASYEARLALLHNGVSIAILSIVLSTLFYSARRREFVQRRTIENQKRLLTELNEELEHRVAEQVREIVGRAAEVDRLNTQLRAQVRERSSELAFALARLTGQNAAQRLVCGTLLGERFEIEQQLGEGGMGCVYSGTDRATGEPVAIKVVQANTLQQAAALHRFLREARSVVAINHPAVVRMLHVDVSDGMLYQVQELVRGDTLECRLQPGHAWAPEVSARLVSTLCAALAAAHQNGVIHRDVKPSNIMLTPGAPGLKLLDFGISKLYEDQWLGGGTVPGTVLGTPAYMSPEQICGSEVTDRVDVYSVGVILFELLTGVHPFARDGSRDVFMHHLTTVPPAPRQLEPRVPQELSDLANACLSKSPGARPSARHVSDALHDFAESAGAPNLEEVSRREQAGAPESGGARSTGEPGTWESPGAPSSDQRARQESNLRPTAPEIDGIPNEFQALNYQNGQLVANAEHYLRAVAVRNRRAKKYAEDLARAVLALDVVVLAKDVLRGDVLRYSSATRLAEAILMAAGKTPVTKAENGDG